MKWLRIFLLFPVWNPCLKRLWIFLLFPVWNLCLKRLWILNIFSVWNPHLKRLWIFLKKFLSGNSMWGAHAGRCKNYNPPHSPTKKNIVKNTLNFSRFLRLKISVWKDFEIFAKMSLYNFVWGKKLFQTDPVPVLILGSPSQSLGSSFQCVVSKGHKRKHLFISSFQHFCKHLSIRKQFTVRQHSNHLQCFKI